MMSSYVRWGTCGVLITKRIFTDETRVKLRFEVKI